MTTDDFQISWLHCNVCHRAFEGHNQVKLSGDRLLLSHSDLYFYFTGCGHFFCENCLQEKGGRGPERVQGNIQCKICGDQTQAFKIQSTIPDKVAMYMKPPISLLEDSLSIMMFQLNNANKLINALRLKISSQKDLLSRAKQEIANAKELKEIPSEFHQNYHHQQQRRREQPGFSPFMGARSSSRGIGYNSSSFNPPPDSPLIHVAGRLSLKSPSINANAMNSPFPGPLPMRSKQPRPVMKRH